MKKLILLLLPTLAILTTGQQSQLGGAGSGSANWGIQSAAVLSLPTPTNFPNTTVGSTSSAVVDVLQNIGSAPATLSGFAVSGDFAISLNTCGATLSPGVSCNISLIFNPTNTGLRTGTLSITSNALVNPSSTLQGTGTAPTTPDSTLSPTTATFPDTLVGNTSVATVFTLTSSGTATLTISSDTLSGTNAADFSISATTCGGTLGVGLTCTYSVTFTPSTTGLRSAQLNVVSNGVSTPNVATFSGRGVAPGASLSPGTLAFGNVTQNTASSPLTTTLTNTGTSTLNISSITLSGANAADFSKTTTCVATLAAVATCTITVTFTPSLVASESATLSVADDASGSPQTVSLTGTGTTPPVPLSWVSTSPLPNGIVTIANSFTFQAAGGTPGYMFSLVPGSSFPPGESLATPTLSGTPTTPGVYNFTMQVNDSASHSVQKAFQQTIVANNTTDNPYCPVSEVPVYPGGATTDDIADLPTACIETNIASTPSNGAIHTIAAADAAGFQTAINTAAPGDQIVLAAGSTYTGSFVFPANSNNITHWLTIRTSDLADLPAEHRRALPCQANVQLPSRPATPGPGNCATLVAAMAKIKGSGSLDEAIRVAPGANYIRWIGIEVEGKTVGTGLQNQNIINMQSATTDCGTTHLIFDRMWIHGIANFSYVRAGFMQDGVCYVALINSSVTDIHCKVGVCTDSQIFQGGPGSHAKTAFEGINNYVEWAGTNSTSFGGVQATVMPTDLTWIGNYQYKPWAWNPACVAPLPSSCRLPDGTPVTYDGLGPYSTKNIMELKTLIRGLVEGNVMENNWMYADQAAFAFLLTPKNQSGNLCPGCIERHITFRYNHIISSGGFLQAANAGADDGGLATEGSHYSIHDDLAENLNFKGVVNTGHSFGTYGVQENGVTSLTAGNTFLPHDWHIFHITMVAAQPYIAMHLMDGPIGALYSGMVFRDSIMTYGFQGMNQTSNTACAGPTSNNFLGKYNNCWTAGYVMTKNVIIGGGNGFPGTWPVGNFLPANPTAVGFANYNNAAYGDFRLCTGVATPVASCNAPSPYINGATDGTNIGADINQVMSHTAGVSPWN